jgi:hypothetical protein
MNARDEELIVRRLLEDPALVNLYFKERRWAELAALVRFAKRDVPVSLAQSDPALYRRLREQVTRFFCWEGAHFHSKNWRNNCCTQQKMAGGED